MDRNIKIEIKDRVAHLVGNPKIICGNNDYSVTFTFDDEWTGVDVKTLRVSYNNKYSDHVFSGDTVELPPIIKAVEVYLGVFAGDITSTKVAVRAEPSILCAGGSVADPEPDVYKQIIDLINSREPSGGSGSGVPGEPGEDGGYYVPRIDADGNLSWTASDEDMPSVDTVNIKGAKGDKGEPGKDATPYTLPTASADVKGGVKIGEGLQMDGDVLEVVGGVEGKKYHRIKTITLTEDQAGVKDITEMFESVYNGLIVTIENTDTFTTQKGIFVGFGHDGINRACGTNVPPSHAMRAVCRDLDGIWDIFGYVGHPSGMSSMIGQVSAQNISTSTNDLSGFSSNFKNINHMRVYTFVEDGFPSGMTIKIYGKAAN